METLKDLEIVKLSTLIKNIDTKLSASSGIDKKYQILCLVCQNNQICFRYISESGEVIVKMISWFTENGKCIQDICFDGSGTWLLVFCYDNTLHIVPALPICDTSITFDNIFNCSEITSYVVPFIGPHECPNSQTCPNTQLSQRSSIIADELMDKTITNRLSLSSLSTVAELIAPQKSYNKFYCDLPSPTNSNSEAADNLSESENEHNSASKSSTPLDSKMFGSSIDSSGSHICPYPTCCTWWKTLNDEQRAILGYSDGSICVVALTPNFPYLGNTSCEKGSIDQLIICQDNSMETITLMINTSTKEQWKLLLEQKSIKYTFPGDITPTTSFELRTEMMKNLSDDKSVSSDGIEDWQIVLSMPPNSDYNGDDKSEQEDSAGEIQPNETPKSKSTPEDGTPSPKLFPAAKARLQSLRDLGAKKIGTLKLKLAESRIKAKEKEKIREQAANLTIMELPGITPEILTTPAGPYFIVQYMDNRYLLSALHSYSDTLSVHSMDISLIPLYIYKIPSQCQTTVLTRNVLYVFQNLNMDPPTPTDLTETIENNMEHTDTNTISSQDDSVDEINAVSVISSEMSSMKLGDDCEFNENALLALFKFPDEKVINIHRMTSTERVESSGPILLNEERELRPTMKSNVANYTKMQKGLRFEKKYDNSEMQILASDFPKVEFEKCFIVTDKNLYCIELSDKPCNLFLKMAHKAMWASCEDFCTTFSLPLSQCIEYAGDVLLRRKKITEALMTYNIARLAPMKTALKLAMFSEVGALMKLCSMALKNSYIVDSKYLMHDIMKILIDQAHLGNVRYDSLLNVKKKNESLKPVNSGDPCSDFSYDSDDIGSDLQISNSAQFHLSNLMFLTLCEKCVRDKNYIPLWNFITTNSKYHTSLASIVLCQSGLYSSVILMAMTRGACLDVFSCLVGVGEHIFDIPPEMNVFMYNLSDEIFMECIIYMQNYSIDYFELIRKNIDRFDVNVMARLGKQLNPFNPIYRPIMYKLSNHSTDATGSKELDKKFLFFCKTFIETFIIVLIKAQLFKLHNDSFLNALNLFRVYFDEKQVNMKMPQFSPLSTGFSHAACVVNNVAYVWGCNGVNCALGRHTLQSDPLEPTNTPHRVDFLKNIDLEVLAVQCGRLHTLILTNNGLYSMGANHLGQLGVGNHLINALQPTLIREFDGKSISHLCAGQYHNAVVADGFLYTWGWGVYGQLGHGDILDLPEPEVVKFFHNKTVLQVSLGHAHSLVLCKVEGAKWNTLYVFGSNHYGQLGVGHDDNYVGNVDIDNKKKSFMKSLVPIKIEFFENILLINTKFFCNLVLTETNLLYTWGSSPQALRLATQARKRAKSSHKSRKSDDNKSDESSQISTAKKTEIPKTTSTDNVSEETTVFGSGSELPTIPEIRVEDTSEGDEPVFKPAEEPKPIILEESTDHLFPSLVDTTLVNDDIVAISSGLYHFALLTPKSILYTWGKNIERQLGREGGRTEVLIPTRLDAVPDVLYVECGADFTLIMTEQCEVKAFGNNNMGQCGKEINLDKSGAPGKLVRLPISNRLVRIPDSSQFIELPYLIKLPRNEKVYTGTIRFLKSLPKFRRSYVIQSNLAKVFNRHGTIDSNMNDLCKDPEMNFESDNNNKVISSQSTSHPSTPSTPVVDENDGSSISTSRLFNDKYASRNDFIHYCLYIFHGLYEQNSILTYTQRSNEYHIRMLMLSYNYLEAFKLSMELHKKEAPQSTESLIQIFEFFTKDSNVIPMEPDHVKCFIYELIMYFIKHELDLDDLEEYFLSNLDCYLLQLSYILYFNNKNNNNSENSELEKKLFDKFNNNSNNTNPIVSALIQKNQQCKLENSEIIIKMLSTKFNVIVCQKLIEYCENYK